MTVSSQALQKVGEGQKREGTVEKMSLYLTGENS